MKKLKYFGDRQAYNIKSVESLRTYLFPGFLNLTESQARHQNALKNFESNKTSEKPAYDKKTAFSLGLNIEFLLRGRTKFALFPLVFQGRIKTDKGEFF